MAERPGASDDATSLGSVGTWVRSIHISIVPLGRARSEYQLVRKKCVR